jgi:hypothetical protein
MNEMLVMTNSCHRTAASANGVEAITPDQAIGIEPGAHRRKREEPGAGASGSGSWRVRPYTAVTVNSPPLGNPMFLWSPSARYTKIRLIARLVPRHRERRRGPQDSERGDERLGVHDDSPWSAAPWPADDRR